MEKLNIMKIFQLRKMKINVTQNSECFNGSTEFL